MKNLTYITNEQTYQVINEESNAYNFCGLVEIEEQLLDDAENGMEYNLNEELPGDVKTAVDTMIENGVEIDTFTGISTFEIEDTTYYMLTW